MCSQYPVGTELRQSVCHHFIKLLLDKQIVPSNLDLGDLVLLYYNTHVGFGNAVFLCHFCRCAVAVVGNEVGAAKLIKMALGVIGASVLTLTRYLVVMGI